MRISHTQHDAVSAAKTVEPLQHTILEAVRQFDTCTIANAIEHFRVRLRNEGFTRPGLQCVTGGAPRLLGYAATCRVRSADPPMSGNAYVDRTDWWETIGLLPVPRIAVFQDLDSTASGASTVGEVHAAVLKALQCEGVITNGCVRDIPASEQNGVSGVRLSCVRFPRIHACCRFRNPGRNLRAWGAIRRPAVRGCPRSRLHSARYCRPHPRSGSRNPRERAQDHRPVPVGRILPGKAAASCSDQAMRTFMRSVVSPPYALLFVMAAACLTSSCSKQAPVHASDAQPTDIPTVAVAKVSTEDLSHGLVLTAEFKPFQE